MSTQSNPISKKLHHVKLSALIEGQKIVTVKSTDILDSVVKVRSLIYIAVFVGLREGSRCGRGYFPVNNFRVLYRFPFSWAPRKLSDIFTL